MTKHLRHQFVLAAALFCGSAQPSPTLIVNGVPGQSGNIETVYEELGCNAFLPYGLSLLNNRSRVIVASNLSLNAFGLEDSLVAEAPLLSLDTGVFDFSDVGQVWAVWTPSARVVDPPPDDPPSVDPRGAVPEPSSLSSS